jgi:hypothetical protein
MSWRGPSTAELSVMRTSCQDGTTSETGQSQRLIFADHQHGVALGRLKD